MKILVTGGAGYIGSFMIRKLKAEGHMIVVVDNLSYGHIEAVKGFDLRKIDLVTEKEKVFTLFQNEKFDAIVHMASFIQMGESFTNPSKYYRNNVLGFLNLIDAMVKNNCMKIILSSSAGVYGNPIKLPIEEDDPKNPLNPYGETKYIMERILEDYDSAYGLKFISLRYFNAAGGAIDGSIGEDHPEESHLIPNIIAKALKNEEVQIFGEDYDTADGTCIRDYVHVLDLVDAHALALNFLEKENKSEIFNIGIGKGYSNKEVIKMVEKIGNLNVNVRYGSRREGDASVLYASNAKIKNDMDWSPKYDLDAIIESALLWHKNHPNGYDNID